MNRLLTLIIHFITLPSLLLFSHIVESQENDETIWLGRITASSLIIRSEPNKDGKILGKVAKGHRVEILKETNNIDTINDIKSTWFRVKTSNNIIGFMFGGYIEKANNKIPDRDLSVHSNLLKACSKEKKDCEKLILNDFSDKIKRNENTLIIKTSKGTVKFKDNDDTNLKHNIFQYYPELKIFVIEVWEYFEVNWFYIVNEIDGNFVSIVGQPVVSADKKRIVSIQNYGVTGYGDNQIQVFNIQNNIFKKEFEIIINWGPKYPLWLGEKKISIVRDDLELPSYKSRYSLVELDYINRKWILNE
ncbi:MAG: SH3 domain-containing protein [Spirochaetia bacterium]|nr:SH3 domain-containing protein [Spirochaetia bacterium]